MNNSSKFSIGIRAKLSIFTAFFIITIIALISFLTLQRQYSSLTESLNREIEPILKYTEKIVLDLENLTDSLLMIEDFRNRLATKKQELSKYRQKTVVVVQEKSWFVKNVLGKLNVIKKDLVDTKDQTKFTFRDTFFSEYITEKKLQEIEDNVRSIIRDERGNIISKNKFTEIQKIANKAAEYKKELDSYLENINNLQSQKQESTEPNIIESNQKIEKNIELIKNQITLKQELFDSEMNDLKQEILNFLYQFQKNNIQEVGLNIELIRIQTFDIKNFKIGFDTNIFAQPNILNSQQLIANQELQKDWESRVKNTKINSLLSFDPVPKEFKINERTYEVAYKPFFKKPSIVERARIIQVNKDDGHWKKYLEEDKNISSEIKGLATKIKRRLSELRAGKSAKPSTDSVFKESYKEYQILLDKRSELNRSFAKATQIEGSSELIKKIEGLTTTLNSQEKDITVLKETLKTNTEDSLRIKIEEEILQKQHSYYDTKNEIDGLERNLNNWTKSKDLITQEAFNNLRDAALYEYGILWFKYNSSSYNDYLGSLYNRESYNAKYRMIRKWIMDANSETNVPFTKYNNDEMDTFEGGVLSRSRSEMEEEMWRLDSTPLYEFVNGKESGLSTELYTLNLAGFTRSLIDKSNGLTKIREDIKQIVYNAGGFGIVAIFITLFFASMMVKSIRDISYKAGLVGHGDLSVQFAVTGHDEIGTLSNTMNQMVIGLIERDKATSALGRFVNPQIAEMVLKQELKLGGERKECAIFFSDIRSFTSISEKLQPEQVVEFLNEYMSVMVKCVNETGGIVDKFIGDAIMATWGAAYTRGNNAENSINASLMMRRELLKFNEGRGSVEKPIIKIGCGLNYGPVIAGQIGSEERLEYTVIGDAVNLASRVESLNKPFGTDVLITEDLYQQVKDVFRVEQMQAIKVKGKSEPQIIYAVLGRFDDPECPETLKELRKQLGIEHDSDKEISTEKEEKFEVIG